MKHIKINSENNVRLWKKAIRAISMTALLVGIILGNFQNAFAQFTFMGDYDRTFAAPLGYYVDPQFPDPNQTGDVNSSFTTGDVMSDGSIVAAGQFIKLDGVYDHEFYIKKFLPSGVLDASFNGGRGFIIPDFHVFDPTPVGGIANSQTMSTPDGAVRAPSKYIAKLKVLPDNKILVVGVCEMSGVRSGTGISSLIFGKGICMMRFNPNGTLDTTFGTAGDFQFASLNNPNIGSTYREYPGMVWTPVGNQPMIRYPAEIDNFDVVIQPDGKILIAGTTRTRLQPSISTQRESGFLLRYTSQGALDASFGNNGAIHYFANPTQPAECTPRRYFFGVAVQPDGRILALGTDGTVRADCPSTGVNFQGNRFVVTRWTANGQFETARYLDNNTAYDQFSRGRATAAVFSKDGSKVIVSGSYDCKATLAKFNVGDLSLDTTFGTNGIAGYRQSCGNDVGLFGTTLFLKTIQPDGKILGTDNVQTFPRLTRFNPNGSPDLSFGNENAVGGTPFAGSLHVNVLHYNNANSRVIHEHVIVRPNGRLLLFGHSFAFQPARAVVSQQNTVLKNGNYSDFTNDGKAEIAVFRPSNGAWYQLNSANGAFSGVIFGFGTDKPVPADYDGDGKTDIAVFRDGFWYYLQSSDGAFRGLQFGSPEDLPRPGDFDGDGKADIAVFRPSNGSWYYLRSSDNQFVGLAFGQNGDVPLLADFDGDGKSDIAVFRGGFWYYLQSSNGEFRGLQFGLGTDIPTVGDYDGDGKSDISVFRNGNWYRLNSSTGAFVGFQWGQSGDKPTAADYDGDGKTDLAVFRNGDWYVLNSGNNSFFGTTFGFSTDVPIPSVYLP